MELAYLSGREKSVGGSIKQSPGDFMVEEIMPDGTVLEIGKTVEKESSGSSFVHFVLQKEDWSTTDAVREIASRLHVSAKRMNYAGMKDKRALTTQVVSAFGVKKEAVLGLKAGGMKILGAWNSEEKVELGALLGNRFRIRVEGAEQRVVDEIYSGLGGKFPNYFGPQRFGGSRGNTHLIGQKLMQSDLRGAVESYLFEFEGEVNREAVEARKKLAEEKDYKNALKYFPNHLRLERLLIVGLAENPRDYAHALRKLPRQMLLMFVHAFQSHLFNIMLSERLAEGELKLEKGEYFCGEKSGFPDLQRRLGGKTDGWLVGKIIGYESETNERDEEILERFDLRKQDFKMKVLPEINSKGAHRTLFAPMKDFEYRDGWFSFSLPAGSYATSALREFIKDLW
ncbi:MAG: tRNA pseudouridine(13) synthase TruD [Candidatus ainarchaeum sp.]|nr:tRNA pseudouridine(13) synthase TruD [Candidatus ainarchaeum sp.]